MTAAFSDTPASMLERFTAIIDSFSDDAAVLTLDQIAMRTGLPRSTTHRILDQLVRLRWIGHGAGGYRLGERTAGGRSQAGTVEEPADVRLRTAAAPVLHELQLGTGAVVHLGLLERGRIVHLDKLGGAGARRVPTAVGARIRADRLALGVAALATLHPEEVIAEITDLDEHWQAPPAWGSEFHSARRRVVTRSGDYAADLVSVAAPVGMRAAIGIVTGDRVHAQRCAPLVAAAAAQVRRALAAAPAQA